MFKRLLSVGGFTLLSRITGFLRDMLMAWYLGKGVLSDAFIVAFLFPNYFRSIFGEGTINPAFLPRYAALWAKGEKNAAALFADRVFSWQMSVQFVVLILAMAFMPTIMHRHRAGLRGQSRAAGADRQPRAHHVSLSHPDAGRDPDFGDAERHREILGGGGVVEFPESRHDRDAARLALVSQCGLCGGVGLARSAASHNSSSCCGPAARDGITLRITWPRWTPEIKEFFVALGAVTVGAASVSHRAVHRHDHREPSARRQPDGALLCRPHQSIAAGRAGHRARHRAVAGNVGAAGAGRSRRLGCGAKPLGRAVAAADAAVHGGVRRHPRHDHARDLRDMARSTKTPRRCPPLRWRLMAWGFRPWR